MSDRSVIKCFIDAEIHQRIRWKSSMFRNKCQVNVKNKWTTEGSFFSNCFRNVRKKENEYKILHRQTKLRKCFTSFSYLSMFYCLRKRLEKPLMIWDCQFYSFRCWSLLTPTDTSPVQDIIFILFFPKESLELWNWNADYTKLNKDC